jgi:hypothetical protein
MRPATGASDDGITQAGFQEASGVDSSTGSIDYREGTTNSTTRPISRLPA